MAPSFRKDPKPCREEPTYVYRQLAQLVAGADHPEPIQAALGAVGFDEDEIKAVMAGGGAPYMLRRPSAWLAVMKTASCCTIWRSD